MQIGVDAPQLRVLNLGECRLAPLDAAAAAALAGKFAALRTLVLNGTRLSWGEVEAWDAAAPGLAELHVASTALSRIVDAPARFDRDAQPQRVVTSDGSFLPANRFAHVATIDVSDNPLPWGQIYAFSKLPALSWLIATNTKITEIWVETALDSGTVSVPPPSSTDAPGSTLPFGQLAQVALSGCQLEALWSVDALDAFPALTSLRIGPSDVGKSMGLGPIEARQV